LFYFGKAMAQYQQILTQGLVVEVRFIDTVLLLSTKMLLMIIIAVQENNVMQYTIIQDILCSKDIDIPQ